MAEPANCTGTQAYFCDHCKVKRTKTSTPSLCARAARSAHPPPQSMTKSNFKNLVDSLPQDFLPHTNLSHKKTMINPEMLMILVEQSTINAEKDTIHFQVLERERTIVSRILIRKIASGSLTQRNLRSSFLTIPHQEATTTITHHPKPRIQRVILNRTKRTNQNYSKESLYHLKNSPDSYKVYAKEERSHYSFNYTVHIIFIHVLPSQPLSRTFILSSS
ncbi:hypothetical protein KEM48_009418 [Puccinia striiformis f. sp. tritici PST-130]|nr:hypothetical protein KEM48_009418 [Puccinia striiformis f. sp. tritici PST-130]